VDSFGAGAGGCGECVVSVWWVASGLTGLPSHDTFEAAPSLPRY
jgi:hypothetical protein